MSFLTGGLLFFSSPMKEKNNTPTLRVKAIKFKPANGSERKTGAYCLRIAGQKFTPMVKYTVLYRDLQAITKAIKPEQWWQLPANKLKVDNGVISGIVWLEKAERERMGWATEFIERTGVDIFANPNAN